jgi:hypothetical protein
MSVGQRISVYCLLQFTGVRYNMRSIALTATTNHKKTGAGSAIMICGDDQEDS